MRKNIVNVIEKLYAAGADEASWADALASVTEHFDAVGSHLYFVGVDDNSMPFELAHNFDQAALDGYREVISDRCERTAFLKAHPGLPVYYDYLHTDDERIARDEVYNLYKENAGISYYLGLASQPTRSHFAALSINRSQKIGHASAAEIAEAALIGKHLQRALKVSFMLGLAGAARRPDTGMCLVDATGRILFMDQAFTRMSSSGDGIDAASGRIQIADDFARPLVERDLAEVTSGGMSAPSSRPVRRPSGREPYQLAVTRAPSMPIPASKPARAMITLRDVDAEIGDAAMNLAQANSLTERETQIVRELLKARTVDEIAKVIGVSRETVRSHKRAIFHKCGVSSHAELIRLGS